MNHPLPFSEIIYASSCLNEQALFLKHIKKTNDNINCLTVKSCFEIHEMIKQNDLCNKMLFCDLHLADGDIFSILNSTHQATIAVLSSIKGQDIAYKVLTGGAHYYILKDSDYNYLVQIKNLIQYHLETPPKPLLRPSIQTTLKKLNDLKESNYREIAALLQLEATLQEIEDELLLMLNSFHRSKEDIVKAISLKIQNGIVPLIETLSKQWDYEQINLIEKKIHQLNKNAISIKALSEANLTPTEHKICDFISLDLSAKEIARLLNTAISTIHGHKKSIRKKLGLTNKSTQLKSILCPT
jgi:DNA-binding NarL/FixJ family response regulator